MADTSPAAQDYGYAYDGAWNLNYRTNNGSVTTFNVDGKNQLSGGSFAYDDNGNLTNNSSGLSYEYDDENQLIAMQLITLDELGNPSGWRNEFIYDGLGRLRQRRDFSIAPANPGFVLGGDTQWTFDTKTDYIYDGRRVIQERDLSSNPVVSYTRGTDLSGTLEGAGGIGGLLGCSLGTTNLAYFADGNGNITYLLNSSQSMVASYRYDPFGNTITKSGALADANVYRFSSKEIHSNSGMYYYGFRFYDPALQRWINRDPINELGFKVLIHRIAGLNRREEKNLYRSVANNPVSNWDYLGLDNPGCDPPGDKTIKLCPDKKDCILRCCAEHDKCYYDNDCSATSWIIESSPECMACNTTAALCINLSCKAGKGKLPTGPRWFCPNGPNAGKSYDNYDEIPASCWKDGKKPPTPQPDVDPKPKLGQP